MATPLEIVVDSRTLAWLASEGAPIQFGDELGGHLVTRTGHELHLDPCCPGTLGSPVHPYELLPASSRTRTYCALCASEHPLPAVLNGAWAQVRDLLLTLQDVQTWLPAVGRSLLHEAGSRLLAAKLDLATALRTPLSQDVIAATPPAALAWRTTALEQIRERIEAAEVRLLKRWRSRPKARKGAGERFVLTTLLHQVNQASRDNPLLEPARRAIAGWPTVALSRHRLVGSLALSVPQAWMVSRAPVVKFSDQPSWLVMMEGRGFFIDLGPAREVSERAWVLFRHCVDREGAQKAPLLLDECELAARDLTEPTWELLVEVLDAAPQVSLADAFSIVEGLLEVDYPKEVCDLFAKLCVASPDCAPRDVLTAARGVLAAV